MTILLSSPAQACYPVENGAGFADCEKWDKDTSERNRARLEKKQADAHKQHNAKVEKCMAENAHLKNTRDLEAQCSRQVRFQERSKGR